MGGEKQPTPGEIAKSNEIGEQNRDLVNALEGKIGRGKKIMIYKDEIYDDYLGAFQGVEGSFLVFTKLKNKGDMPSSRDEERSISLDAIRRIDLLDQRDGSFESTVWERPKAK